MTKKQSANKPRSRRRRVVAWSIGAFLLACAIDAFVYEPYRPVLSTYDIAIPGLPATLDGFRVVQLSDLHRSSEGSDGIIKAAVDIANSTHADIAVITGDFVYRSAINAVPCCCVLGNLRAKFGSFAVLGNHDNSTGAPRVSKAINNSSIVLLNNKNVRLPNGLVVVGLSDVTLGISKDRVMFDGVEKTEPCLFLAHSQLSIDRLRGRTGLLLTGHTHGGQVSIPIVTRLVVSHFLGCNMLSGYHSKGRVLMYVNRGIGTIFCRMRFRCRSEVTLFILHPTNQSRPYVMRS